MEVYFVSIISTISKKNNTPIGIKEDSVSQISAKFGE